MAATKLLHKQCMKNKRAKAALRKMSRKLQQARRAKDLVEIRVLLGMAQVALAKAEFIAVAKGGRK